MAHGRADYRTGTAAQQSAAARAHLTIGKWLPRTSAKEEHNRECDSGGRNPTFAHKRYLLSERSHAPSLLVHITSTASNCFWTALWRCFLFYIRLRVQIVSLRLSTGPRDREIRSFGLARLLEPVDLGALLIDLPLLRVQGPASAGIRVFEVLQPVT